MNILFLCVANSARSQLAEGLGKAIFGNLAHIESAGSEPSGTVQPWAIKVLSEVQIDISKNKSKSINDLPSSFYSNLDYVITLCKEEVCPILPTKATRLHWPIKDPATVDETSRPQAFRAARDEIKEKIIALKNEIMKS